MIPAGNSLNISQGISAITFDYVPTADFPEDVWFFTVEVHSLRYRWCHLEPSCCIAAIWSAPAPGLTRAFVYCTVHRRSKKTQNFSFDKLNIFYRTATDAIALGFYYIKCSQCLLRAPQASIQHLSPCARQLRTLPGELENVREVDPQTAGSPNQCNNSVERCSILNLIDTHVVASFKCCGLQSM